MRPLPEFFCGGRFFRPLVRAAAGNFQVLVAQGVAATVALGGAESTGSGANIFPRRKPLRRKELTPQPRQEYETAVDKC
jgi:hypothetical protein